MIGRLSDAIVSRLLPGKVAMADPGCECHTYGATTEYQCYCYCGAGSFGWSQRSTCTCDGCHWNCGSCHDTWHGCVCT
jgi:hypothetical protein